MSVSFHSFPLHAVSICSTSQREVVWALHRNGERGKMHLHLSKRRELSAPRAATALVSNPWSSTWLVSTSWRANNPGNISLLVYFSPLEQHIANLTISGGHVFQEIPHTLHPHAPTSEWARAVGCRWLPGSVRVCICCMDDES